MQTRAQSSLEVGIDFGFSLLMNIGAQLLFYSALATAGRSLAVAALVLGLAIPRRYAIVIRRLFNALLPRNVRQPRWQAWLEVGVDTVLGFCVAMVLQWLFYGAAATWAPPSSQKASDPSVTSGV